MYIAMTGKGQNQENYKKRDWGKTEAEKTLIGLNKQDKLAQTNRKHRYKYPGDKWGRWATPGEGWRQAQGRVKQIRA
jgi:hypothetical protein